MEVSTFKSSNSLEFKISEWEFNNMFTWQQKHPIYRYRCGTCDGIFEDGENHVGVIAIVNSQPQNGHFNDTMEWFDYMAQSTNRELKFFEIWNDRLYKHLIDKRGHIAIDIQNTRKTFTNE